MNRAGLKTRDIKYKSNKNDRVMVVHTEDARSYAKYLEERDEIVSYDVCVPLDPGALDRVDKVDIRGDYFRQQWESDFQLIYVDGTYGIREVIKPDDMEKLSEIEKLELSRRYWKLLGITDWKVVLVR